MFSSSDPFAYPNQPMATFENRQFAKQEYPYNQNMYNQNSNSTTSPDFDNLDSQRYGHMPPYVMQGQTPGDGLPDMSVPLDMSGGASTSAMNCSDGPWVQQPGRQGVVTPGMNLDQIFGEDWSVGWMDQGYRQ